MRLGASQFAFRQTGLYSLTVGRFTFMSQSKYEQKKRRLLGYSAVFICLLLIGCRSEISSIESEPTTTPQGPAVISNNPDVIVESWEYISPRSEEALTSFLSRDPEAIEFGPEHYEAHIVWREDGFIIVWGNFFCSTQPILTIDHVKIELWLNDGIWEDCISEQAIHAFRVELETNIPPEEWTYVIHQDAPP